MNTHRHTHGFPQRDDLRPAVTALDERISQLTASAHTPEDAAIVEGLTAAWAHLVEVLALGPEPLVRECPVCKQVGMRDAKVCGYCWTKLVPLSA